MGGLRVDWYKAGDPAWENGITAKKNQEDYLVLFYNAKIDSEAKKDSGRKKYVSLYILAT
jgi:hypothetical protein